MKNRSRYRALMETTPEMARNAVRNKQQYLVRERNRTEGSEAWDSDIEEVVEARLEQQIEYIWTTRKSCKSCRKSCNVHLRESRKHPKEKGKDPHQLREGGKHSGNGKSGTSACYTNFNFVKDYDHKDGTVERADTYRAHSDPSNFQLWRRRQKRSSRLRCLREKTTRFLHMLLRTTSLLSRRPDWMHLLLLPTGRTTILTQKLAYSWSKPKNELTFLSERRKERTKARASFLFVHHARNWRIADSGRKN